MQKTQAYTDFVKLLTQHQPALRGFIIALLPGCDDVGDVLQETNVVLWEKMGSYQAGSNFQAWAFSVAKIKVMQYWDQQKKTRGVSLSQVALEAIATARIEESHTVEDMKLLALEQCMHNLRGTEQAVVNARYTRGESLESLAKHLGTSGGSLRVTLFRIRNKLRKCVDMRLKEQGGLT
ncbi:sigma-70 family RNA polymerase sigma factor [Rubritalea tangerina]|uniref:Sigma-70 family RNA polymerase sigma factor n=1 Tax=Rubritalea tangerina TaxID=430798 RepID=A0ABW4ZA11_9BACT